MPTVLLYVRDTLASKFEYVDQIADSPISGNQVSR